LEPPSPTKAIATPPVTVGAHHALRQVGNVHGAALAAAQSVAAAIDLFHHRLDVAALGDAMAVASVGAGDVVFVLQVHAHPHARGFLAGVKVHEPGDRPGGELVMHPVLELADRAHLRISLGELFSAQLKHGIVSSLVVIRSNV
jgi:hypothetical protein